MITNGVPFAGYHWIPQVVLMAFALVLVLALLIVALLLAWGFGSKPRNGGRASRPLILAWDDGAYHLELWAGLPAEELIAVARSVRPEH